MPNPLAAAWSYLRGDDLRLPRIDTMSKGVVRPGAAPERKMYYFSDVGAAIRLGALVHGPGASELLGYATGHGQDANSVVFACLRALCFGYIEAPPRVYTFPRDGGDPEVVPEHPLELLLQEPNPHHAGTELLWWTQWAKNVHGNAYWLKVRAGDEVTGNVVEYWPISPTYIAPVTTKADRQRGVFISSYKWEYETGKYRELPLENVVHLRYGLDDYDHRLGISPLRRLVREVMTDDEATRFTDSLLKNFAIPGLVATTTADLTSDEADEVKHKLSTKFGSGNQGNVAVLTDGMTLAQFGFSPEQLDLKGIHRLPEERICADMGVPAIIAGVGAGLDRSTYANFREAREMFTEQTLLPLYSMDAQIFTRQLLRDFTSDTRQRVRFDITNLRALQEDEDKKYARLNLGVQNKWITKNEARADVGLPPIEGGDELEAPAPPQPPGTPGQEQDELSQRRQQRQPPAGQAAPAQARARLVAEGKALPSGARITAQDFPELLAAIRELAEPSLTDDLRALMDGQRERVKRRLLADLLDSGTADPGTARAALPRVGVR